MKDKPQSIQEFLETQDCKIDIYNPEMEVQVNVVPGKEKTIINKRIVWKDDEHEWNSFRIPFNSKNDPYYKPSPISWPLIRYAEAIGCTGWNWFQRKSFWVGFDFDSIHGHKQGLSDAELEELKTKAAQIPWITIYRSKGGKGYHFYVFIEPINTNNHTEHAALARSILSQICGLLNFNFTEKVDAVGSILWIWHKNGNKEKKSFELVKKGIILTDIPANWKDHISAITAKRKTLPEALIADNAKFNALTTKLKSTLLDDEHLLLLNWFAKRKTTWWWDADFKMLVCHTHDLKIAHQELHLRGLFDTISTGKNAPNDHNCFCFPTTNGSWIVRRYGLDTKETKLWSRDNTGWIKCFFNKLPDLPTVARLYNGVKTEKEDFVFATFEDAIKALKALGVYINADENKPLLHRTCSLAYGKKDNDIIVTVAKEDSDKYMSDWAEIRGKKWQRIVTCIAEINIIELPDELIRFTVVEDKEDGWLINSKDKWIQAGKDNIKSALISIGYNHQILENVIGQAVFNPWNIVNIPFREEYPGERQWNRKRATYSVTPHYGNFPTWETIITHVAESLDKPISNNPWCTEHNILNGYQYISLWIASMFQYPFEPLPYLFFFGSEDTGKSILHESLQLLFKDNVGYCRADKALSSREVFNGELEGAILCVVEEVNLQKNPEAINRIKDWVTGKTINIRKLYSGSFILPNSTHWIQIANNPSFCPVFSGDSRIVVAKVDTLKNIIPKAELLENLKQEAPAFLHYILNLKIPYSPSRLRIPIIESYEKLELQNSNLNDIQEFLVTYCEYKEGYCIPLADLLNEYLKVYDPLRSSGLSTRTFGKEFLMGKYVKGKHYKTNQVNVGNIAYLNKETEFMRPGKLVVDEKGTLR